MLPNSALSSLGVLGIGAMGADYWFSRNNQIPSTSSTLKLVDTSAVYHDLSSDNIREACREFEEVLGAENVSILRPDLLVHSGSDYQSYGK